ncbi:MAG: carboxylesterase family protein [Lachnospiraceae bacterium]|nr:carboxylesterase family protein [Lachnospiraceae bacterium]
MVVTTKQGAVEGVEQEGCRAFYGIPYAKAPVGELRWRPPQPMEPWEGIRSAGSFPARSIQPQGGGNDFYGREFRDEPAYVTEVSEDCLYLNIWTPAKAAGEKLPVAFWIHGGAFLGGCGHEKEFDGAAYCSRGVILVTINYRLGLLGFLAHPWLSRESEHQVSGNYGTLDQIAALRWVYENIEAFGGDPSNITVFGQSAGAMSVQGLVSTPLTEGMIARAIMQSGGGCGTGLAHERITLREQEHYGEIFAELAGAEELAELRELPAQELLRLFEPFMEKVMPKAGGLFLAPTIDGYLWEEGLSETASQGRVKRIPYLLGSNQDDMLVTPKQKETGEYGELHHACIRFARAMEKQQGGPVWLYYFSHNLPGDQAGAFHSAELWYTFGTLERSWRPFTEADERLSGELLDYWTNFMKTGDPNGPGLKEWEPFAGEEGYIRQFA